MAVITVSRQLGSHGGRISRALAADLGYSFVDKAVINRVIRQYGLVELDLLYDHKPKIWELFNTNSALTIQMLNETIAAIAARGNVVILGRGGFKVLHGMADVLNVMVKAPEDVRVARISKRDGVSAEESAAVIKANDALRSRFCRLFYSADWADEFEFDLVVDTGVGSDDEAKAKIMEALAVLPPASEVDRTAAAAQVNPVLAGTIIEALARKSKTA